MKNDKIDFMPIVGIFLLTLLYALSVCFRGMLTPEEYAFALRLQGSIPEVSGTIIPKIPAMLATLLTAGFLYLTAIVLKLRYPGSAPGMFLIFPPIWWIGTSASTDPILSLLVSVAAAGLFISRRENDVKWKIAGFIGGMAGAFGAAIFVQSGFFTWSGIILSFMPLLFLILAIHLEKLDDRGMLEKKLNRFSLIFAIVIIFSLALLIAPSICRHFRIPYPEVLTIYYGKLIYRPALALIIPLLWLFMAKKSQISAEKLFFICFAVGFIMLALPPAVPWKKFTDTLQKEDIEHMAPELLANDPVCFADESSAAAISYSFNIPVTTVGRGEKHMHPGSLSDEIVKLTDSGRDVLVVSDDSELDSYLPKNSDRTVFTSSQNSKLILFSGEIK